MVAALAPYVLLQLSRLALAKKSNITFSSLKDTKQSPG